MKILKHKAKMLPPKCCNFFFPHRHKVFPVQQYFSLRRTVKRRQNIQKCCLARSGLAHDRDILAFLYRELDVSQCLHLIATKSRRINFFQIMHF